MTCNFPHPSSHLYHSGPNVSILDIKCWDKYGKLWSVVKLSPPSDNLNLQRPLPPVSGQPAPALIVRPGDPRIGGRLCWNCSGSGEVTDEGLFGILFTSTDRCRVCQGAGRTFWSQPIPCSFPFFTQSVGRQCFVMLDQDWCCWIMLNHQRIPVGWRRRSQTGGWVWLLISIV